VIAFFRAALYLVVYIHMGVRLPRQFLFAPAEKQRTSEWGLFSQTIVYWSESQVIESNG
jgi:hypothetical protein